MAKTDIWQFSTTDASNTDIEGINVNVGWPPGNVGQAVRSMMGRLARWSQQVAGPFSFNGAQYTIAAFQRGYIGGLTLSNDGGAPNSVLDIAAGVCVDSTNTIVMPLAALTKSTGGSWAAGSGSNGMGGGLTIANSTWYHVFAIVNAGAADVYFDTSVTAANKPASTTAFRRIGSFLTDGSAHIVAFTQNGDEFLWAVSVLDINGVSVGAASQLLTVTVPTGVKVNALMSAAMTSDTHQIAVFFNAPDQTAATTASGNFQLVCPAANEFAAAQINIRTNTSAQVRVVSSATIATCVVTARTQGYIDTRGRWA